MNGCMGGCRGWRSGFGPWGFGPWGFVRWGFGGWPTREERIEWLEEYRRDLEQQAAEVAEEIRRLRERPTSTV